MDNYTTYLIEHQTKTAQHIPPSMKNTGFGAAQEENSRVNGKHRHHSTSPRKLPKERSEVRFTYEVEQPFDVWDHKPTGLVLKEQQV